MFSIAPLGVGRPPALGMKPRAGTAPDTPRKHGVSSAVNQWLARLESQLATYLRSGRPAWSGIPLDFSAVSPFARAILRSTRRIPAGQVRSYGWVAHASGAVGAPRACGRALASNPLAVLVPCHRVVRSDGTLGGYAWGSVWKRRLLALEARGRAR